MLDDVPGRGGRFTNDPAFATLEAAYEAFLEAWGRWMVGHHRGAPLDPADDEAGLATRLVEARRAVDAALAAVADRRAGLAAADSTALANIRAALPDLDAWAPPLDGWAGEAASARASGEGAAARASGEPGEASEDATTTTLRREVFDAWGAAMAAIELDGERLDRLTVTKQLASIDDPETRRRLFLAMAPAWTIVGGDGGVDSPYRRLVRSSSATWARNGSPIEQNAAGLGLDPTAVEPTMRRILRTWRAVAMPAGLVEPWDYRFHTGALGRRADPLLPVERLRGINDGHLAALGADPIALGIEYDIRPRPGRPVIPTAFTTSIGSCRRADDGSWRSSRPWVFATYAEGGLGNLEELLHESGHAIHYAAVRARPAHFELPPEATAFGEAFADVVGWSTTEPAFLAEHLGLEVDRRDALRERYGGVMLDACWTLFELELHRHPERPPNEVWAEIAERELGVAGHPEWAWWAHRGQLIDGPGYLANYALGAILVAAVRARIRDLRGDWSRGDPGWYSFVSDRLLRWGGARSTASVVAEFLGGPLSVEPLLVDLRAAA